MWRVFSDQLGMPFKEKQALRGLPTPIQVMWTQETAVFTNISTTMPKKRQGGKTYPPMGFWARSKKQLVNLCFRACVVGAADFHVWSLGGVIPSILRKSNRGLRVHASSRVLATLACTRFCVQSQGPKDGEGLGNPGEITLEGWLLLVYFLNQGGCLALVCFAEVIKSVLHSSGQHIGYKTVLGHWGSWTYPSFLLRKTSYNKGLMEKGVKVWVKPPTAYSSTLR